MDYSEENLTAFWCNHCKKMIPINRTTHEHAEMTGETFYCSAGHSFVFSRRSIFNKLKNFRDREARMLNTIVRQQNVIRSMRGVRTRVINRLLDSRCPYCGDHCDDVVEHVRNKHRPVGRRNKS